MFPGFIVCEWEGSHEPRCHPPFPEPEAEAQEGSSGTPRGPASAQWPHLVPSYCALATRPPHSPLFLQSSGPPQDLERTAVSEESGHLEPDYLSSKPDSVTSLLGTLDRALSPSVLPHLSTGVNTALTT